MYRRSFRMSAAILVLAISMATNDLVEAQSLIINGDFDSSIAGWSLPADPEVAITWDGSRGSPDPGSIRFSTTLDPPIAVSFEVFGPCFSVIPSEIFTIEGMVLAEPRPPGMRCLLSVVFYDGLNCTGNRSFIGNVDLSTPGVWESQDRIQQVFASTLSARASLEMEVFSGTGIASCNFDTISLTSNERSALPSEIPTLSWPGLAFLGILVLVSAIIFLRRHGPILR